MAAAKIWKGFGTRVLAYDVRKNPSLEGVVEYVGLDDLLKESHLVSLHCPLLPSTFHLLNAERCVCLLFWWAHPRKCSTAATCLVTMAVFKACLQPHVHIYATELHDWLTCRIAMMREGAFLINVSRGGLLDTEAAIDALERGHIGCLCASIAP